MVKQDFKYFIGYKDNKRIRPLFIFFLEMNIYKRYFDKAKCMYIMINDEKKFDNFGNLINWQFRKKLAI